MDPCPEKAPSFEKMNEHLQKINCLLLPILDLLLPLGTHRNTHASTVDFYLRRHFILGYTESETAAAVSRAWFYRENAFLKGSEPLFPLPCACGLRVCVPSAAETPFPLYLSLLLIHLPFWV